MRQLATKLGFLSLFAAALALPVVAQSNPADTEELQSDGNVVHFLSVGPSMEPTMPACKKDTFVDPHARLAVGDIAAFSCTSKVCNKTDEPRRGYVKRVAEIEQRGDTTCYVMRGDNPKNSFDSDDYGALCEGNDIEIYGSVVGWGGCNA